MIRKTVASSFFTLFILFGCNSDAGNGELNPKETACDGFCERQSLGVEEVEQILRQAVAGAEARGVAATISVVDRVGNVLGLYRMPGAPDVTILDGANNAKGGLEGVAAPADLAAISKAGTGAYLSSQGNAFTSRTASQIVQENFNPGEKFQAGGPLFGVQLSQLPCSDITVLNPQFLGGIPFGRNLTSTGSTGPRPLPLGLSADPGGLPLYKQGDLVGGVGVEIDGRYTLDRIISDVDDSAEEFVAMAASRGFEFPEEVAGDRIFVLGKSLRTVDLKFADIPLPPDPLPVLQAEGLVGAPFLFDGVIRAGSRFGDPESGVLSISRAGVPAAVLVDGNGQPRFPGRAGDPYKGQQLLLEEVNAILDSALMTAFRTRAAIRRPLDSQAHVSIFVVDVSGNILGMVRSGDAPVFGLDVALQKARTAAFFSSDEAGDLLDLVRARNQVGAFEDYVGQVRAFIGDAALTGQSAFTDRAGGNMSRPFFPDGINGNDNGPLSLPFPGDSDAERTWSPFNTGLQLDLIFQRLVQPLGVPVSPPPSLPDTCTDDTVLGERLRNGIQIFPGSVPLYKNGILVGGLGISGDGIDQDDLIAFYGASPQGLSVVGHEGLGDPELGFNAPPAIRADRIRTPVGDSRLRYVNCPESPFRGSDEQRVCNEVSE